MYYRWAVVTIFYPLEYNSVPMNWTDEYSDRITTLSELKKTISLSGDEISYWNGSGVDSNLPLGITGYYASLMSDHEDDPVRLQCIPRVQELLVREYETSDPLGEGLHSPVSRMIHQYKDRVLIKVTDRCAVYCRHCFRRSFTGGESGTISLSELKEIAVYLKQHPEVREILLSGGDCLNLTDNALSLILNELSSKQQPRTFRICTRMPVVLPERITDELVTLLSSQGSVWLVTQFNHPRELTARSLASLRKLSRGGIPLANQSVLLRGINDRVEILEELSHGLVAAGVKPYYLFQGDLASGTSHMRVSLIRGLSIVRELNKRLSGLAMPAYALDLPGGGGKTLLSGVNFLRDEQVSGTGLSGWRFFSGPGEREYRYPLEIEEQE